MDAIIGTLVALVISMMSVAGFTHWGKIGVTNVQTAVTAGQNLTYDKASQQYVSDNGPAIAAIATATVPVTITTAMLIAAGYLPTGFSATNVFQQTWLLQVLQPSPGQLESLVTSQGGTPISNTIQLVQIAAQTGAQGGFVPYANQAGDPTMLATNANGAYGAWKIPLTGFTNPGSGHLASLLAFTSAQANNSYLYRVTVAGQPQLNAMQTDLGMTDTGGTAHNISGVATITATQANLAGGAAGSVNVGAVQFYGDGANAAVRAPGSLYLQGPNGSTTLNIAQVGNIDSTGTVTAPIVNFNTTASTCAWNSVTMRGNNQMWLCNQYGNWVPISNLLGNVYTMQKYLGYMDGWGVQKPTCTNSTPTATIIPQTTGVNVAANPPWETTAPYLVDEGWYWLVQIKMIDTNGNQFTGSDLGLTVEVDTQCLFSNT